MPVRFRLVLICLPAKKLPPVLHDSGGYQKSELKSLLVGRGFSF